MILEAEFPIAGICNFPGERVANFIKFIRVPSSHVGNEDIRLGSLMIDSLARLRSPKG
jgi:hypothetical protein